MDFGDRPGLDRSPGQPLSRRMDTMKAGLPKYRFPKYRLPKYRWALVACLTLWPVLALAQSANLPQNLAACKDGSESCDPSKLSAAQLTEVARAAHVRNVAKCRDGYASCDRSKLSAPEAIALAVADHQRNVNDCNDGMQSCDRSKLTALEGRQVDGGRGAAA